MNLHFESEQDKLIIIWEGDIDHHSVKEFRERIDIMIESKKPKTVILDLKSVAFSDSSGIALVLGRHKLVTALGGKLEVRGACGLVQKVLKLAGVEKYVPISS